MNEIKEIFDLAQKQYSNQMDDCISFRKRSISIAVVAALLLIQSINLHFHIISVMYLICIIILLLSINFKTFSTLPEINALVYYYEEEYSYEKLISTLLGNYQICINGNEKILKRRIMLMKIADILLIIVVIFNIIFLLM